MEEELQEVSEDRFSESVEETMFITKMQRETRIDSVLQLILQGMIHGRCMLFHAQNLLHPCTHTHTHTHTCTCTRTCTRTLWVRREGSGMRCRFVVGKKICPLEKCVMLI